jgi:hypothetical protein
MKMVVFWDVAPWSLVDTTRRNIPKENHLHARRRENLKYHQFLTTEQFLFLGFRG